MVKMSSVREDILNNCSMEEMYFIANLKAWMIRNGISIIKEGADYFSFTNKSKDSKDEILLSFQDLAEVIGYTKIEID
jgi:hypothetical protein